MNTNDIVLICGNLVGSVFDLMARSNSKTISSKVDELLKGDDHED